MKKTFSSKKDLIVLMTGKKLLIQTSNGYFIPVTRRHILMLADSMVKNDDKFCGETIEQLHNFLQITIY